MAVAHAELLLLGFFVLSVRLELLLAAGPVIFTANAQLLFLIRHHVEMDINMLDFVRGFMAWRWFEVVR